MNRQADKWTDNQKGKTDRQTDAQTDMNFELEETELTYCSRYNMIMLE